jgi:hypothetical protein
MLASSGLMNTDFRAPEMTKVKAYLDPFIQKIKHMITGIYGHSAFHGAT